MSALENALRRERAVVGAGLALLTALAAAYVWRGAGMGMSALAMTRLTLFPHLDPRTMAMTPASALTLVSMWWVMMVAMMTPSAAPLILLYGRAMRHHGDAQPGGAYAGSALLAAGYLLAWLAFSVLAAIAQYALQHAALMAPTLAWSRSAALSAVVLAAAGIYQLSPLKRACLRHCRGPFQFLAVRWRTGAAGALRMGLEHGVWCIGCCWMLMALLFVGGVMNLAWIALLTLLVLIEKLAPGGAAVGRAAGAVLVAWSIATLFVH